MKQEYDVIVAGAGPAGAQCARELTRKGYSILLVEKSKEIGQPNFSSAGTPDYTIKEFGLPKSIIADYWDKFQVVSQNQEKTWDYGKPRGYVLKFNELKKFLVQDAIGHGASIMVGSAVTGPMIEKGHVVGVKYSGIRQGEARAKIIVDATGPGSAIGTKVGIRPVVLSPLSVAVEYILTNVHFPKEHILGFYVGSHWVKDGYGWVFPFGKNTAKVGIGVYETSTYPSHDSLKDLTHKFIDQIPWLASAQPIELHGSSLYINGGIDRHVKENVIVIGDAAAQINPLGAEGIRHALRSGRMAAHAIEKSLKSDDVSKLAKYDEDWTNYIGDRWQNSQKLAQFVYHKLNDKLFDNMLKIAGNFTPQEIFDICFEYNFKKALRLTPKVVMRLPFSLSKLLKASVAMQS